MSQRSGYTSISLGKKGTEHEKYDQVYYPNRYLESKLLVDFEEYAKNYIHYCKL